MKRQVLRLLGVAAIATGGLVASAAMAHADSGSGSANGNRFTRIHQHSTVVCGNAIAINGVVHNYCGGSAGAYRDADLDRLHGLFDLTLDFTGDSVTDDAGQWFHIDSRTWS